MDIFFSALGVIISASVICGIVYVRLNRKRLLAKYKRDTPEHEFYSKWLSTKRLLLAAFFLLLFLIGLIRSLMSPSDGDIKSKGLFAGVLFLVIFIIIFAQILYQARSKKR